MSKFLRAHLLLIAFTFILFDTAKAQNCTVNAGINTTICPGNPFILTGAASGLFANTAVWTQVSGPSVTVSATNISGTAATATVSGYTSDVNYTFRLTAKCTDGNLVSQDVVYTVSSLKTAAAGPDTYACPGTFILQGSALASGETGVWTRISGTGPAPNTPASPNSTLTFTNQQSTQTATYRWTVSKTTNGNTCSSFDDVVITNLGTQPVSAGGDISRSCYNVTTSAQLSGSFAGTNGPYGQSALWTFVSGPSTPAISNAAIRNPTVSNLVAGTYIFRYTVTGPCQSGSDEVAVIVAPASQDVTPLGGSNTQTFCDGRTAVLLSAPKALYAGETMEWTKLSGPGTQTFSAATSNVTTVSGLDGASNYSFRYRITNSVTGCISERIYNVTYRNPPSITIMSSNPTFVTCGLTETIVDYTSSGGTGTEYALISAPAGSTIQSSMGGLNNWVNPPNSGQILTGFTKIGTYVLRYRRNTDSGLGGCADAYAEITIVVSAAPTAANAGTRQVLACNVVSTNLAGNIPTVGTGKWSQISGPNSANIVNPPANNSAVTGMISGTYVFRWVISGGDGACANTQSDVEVVVSAPSPTTSAAGNPQALCNNTPVYLQGNTPVRNETGTWTVIKTGSGANSAPEVTFSPNVNTPTAVANGLLGNTSYTFTWTITNACGTSSSDVEITTSNTAGPKAATAGADQCLPSGTTSFTLAGNQPTNGETGTWTRISGPNNPTFNASTYNAIVTGAINGTYVFEWALSRNSCPPTTATTTVTISAPATTANAGADQNVCGTSVTLSANTPTVGTGTWTQTGGGGGAVITDPSSPNTTVTGLTDGRYVFRWTIANSNCAASFDEVTINTSAPSTAPAAGPDQAVCDATSTVLAANAITNGTGSWVAVSGPSIPAFANLNDPATTVSNLVYGTYVLRWTSRAGVFCPVLTDDVTISVTQNANAGSDQSICNATSTTLRGNENSAGTWSLVTQPGGSGTVQFTSVGTNASLVGNLSTGNYVFRYTLPALGGCSSTSDDVEVSVVAPPSAANAGADQAICLPAASANAINTTMAAIAPVSGTGTWTRLESTAGAPVPVIVSPNSATSSITGLGVNTTTGVGVYLFEWKVAGTGPCASNENTNRDIVRITVYREPEAAVAGPDQLSACSNNVIMAATPITYGLGTWTVMSQPATANAVFDAVNSPTTRITSLIAGNYTFRWSVANGNPTCTTKTDDIDVTVTTTSITVADAGPETQSVCNTNFPSTTSFQLNGNLPDASETGTWGIVSQPVGSTLTTSAFDNVNLRTATISGLQAATGAASGVYVLRWTIKNTANQSATDCSSTDDITITVYNTPSNAVAGADQELCLGSALTLAADPVAPERGTGAWSTVTNAGTTPPVFSDPNSPTATVNGLIAGTYVFRWTVSNGSPTCTATISDVQVIVRDCQIAIAKATSTPVQQANGSYNVTLTFKVQNTGNTSLSAVQVEDDLTLTFPAPKTWTVTSVAATGALVANSGFDGNADKNLLSAGSTLAVNATETITVILNVTLN